MPPLRLVLTLFSLLPLTSSGQLATQVIPATSSSTGAVRIPANVPPEIAAQMEAQLQAQMRAQASAVNQAGRSGNNNQRNPEQERSQLLQQLPIDRTPSGILQARLQSTRPPEEQQTEPPNPDHNQENPNNQPPRPLTEQQQQQLEAQQKQQAEFEKKRAEYRRDIEALRVNVVLGNWKDVRAYLDTLPENDAANAFTRILTQLGTQVTVNPRPELAALGAQGHAQPQYLRPAEILAISNLSRQAPDKQALEQLAKLVPRDQTLPAAFFDLLRNGTRYFGTADLDSRHRSSEFLLNAGLLDQALEFLPSAEKARSAKNITALNLLARFHAESHKADKGNPHLPAAWALCTEVMGNPEAPLQERGEALYRALALVPELEDGAGQAWLAKTFTSPQGEGFEILAAVGTLAAQTRQVASDHFRLAQLKLQAAAAKALLETGAADLSAWTETLTLYAINWNHEAQFSYQADQNTSMRPQMQVDDFGNVFYQRERVAFSGRGTSPIPSGDLLGCRPGDKWLGLIDEPVRFDCLAHAARLYLKVKEEQEAFPLLEQLVDTQPERARELVGTMITVWAQNHNPNQQTRYRSSYYYFYGANQRAETIPLTRSKQERNLKELAFLVAQVRSLGLDDTFDEEFADAFIQAHSQAEVWRVEALETVFGALDALDPGTLATLLTRMRINLAALWPDPKLQQQAQTKRQDKELQAQILKGYEAAKSVATDALAREPDNWRLQIQLASLAYEESNYRSTLQPDTAHSAVKRASLDALGLAAAAYAATLPLEDRSKESSEAFETWFYAALGSPDLGALKAHHQPVASEFPMIQAALAALPDKSRDRHLEMFATTLGNRLANVSPDLKFRYLENALPITGPHERIKNASEVFTYYQDLITEIELVTAIDGPDAVGHGEEFGLFVNLRHTQEIERESGGFQRYLQNQNNSPYAYNFGRNTENYRDKFEKAARASLEEHFDVLSLTFHSDKVQSRSDMEHGWRVTPYSYFLLKAKGPEIDSIPPLRMDLDFLDTSGYVVLPVASSAIPVDASASAPRPVRNLAITLTLDERNADKDNLLHLDVKATGHGIVPPLGQLLELPPAGFIITDPGQRDLLIEELDPETDDGAPLATREWRLTLAADGDTRPASFTFPAVKVPVKDGDGLTLQRYQDVDLVQVSDTVSLGSRVGRAVAPWMLVAALAALGILATVLWLVLRRPGPPKLADHGPSLPSTLTPVTLLSYLQRLHHRLPDNQRQELATEIAALQDRFFGPTGASAATHELAEIATRWHPAA